MIMRVEATRMPYLGEKPAKVGRELIFCPKTIHTDWTVKNLKFSTSIHILILGIIMVFFQISQLV